MLILALFSPQVFAVKKILKCDNWDVILPLIERLTPKSIVVLNIDDVILRPDDQILQSRYRASMESLIQKLNMVPSDTSTEDLMGIQLQSRKSSLVDSKVLDVISILKDKGVNVIAISSDWADNYRVIPSFENWQVSELASLGIDLSWVFPNTLPIIFNDYLAAIDGRFPSYRRGLLFTHSMSKGEVLEAFLNHINFKPDQILSVDILMNHINSVKSFCARGDIEFTGVIYDAALTKPRPDLNMERAELQFNTLVKEKKWLSDSEAEVVLKQNAVSP
ncbi:MAG: DUF2608 domain-containing protein [Pseudomonadota bacterium]